MLGDGYHQVPAGKVATVVTTLEMTKKADLRPVPAPNGWVLTRIAEPGLDWYRALFRKVGENWLWFGRILMKDEDLETILRDPDVHVYTLRKGDVDGGFLELDFRSKGACEVAYFGLARELIGTGAGRFLMNAAIEKAWAADIARAYLYTCTLDSPQALPFYRRSGFVPISQKVEIADDPRIAHGYDRALGPHVPIYDV